MTKMMFKVSLCLVIALIGLMFVMDIVGNDSLLVTVVYREGNSRILDTGFMLVDTGHNLTLTRDAPDDATETPILSPDGRYAVFMRNDPQNPNQIAFTMYDIEQDRSIPFGDAPSFAVGWYEGWSPGGRYFLYRENNVLMRYDVRDDSQDVLFDTLDASSRAWWSPDGAWIALQISNDLHIMSNVDGSTRFVDTRSGEAHLVMWSPDSTQLAYMDAGTIRLYALADDSHRDIVRFSDPVTLRAWSPDGRWLTVVTDNAITEEIVFNVDTHTRSIHRITQGINVSSLVWSPDSEVLASVIGFYDDDVHNALFISAPTSRADTPVVTFANRPLWYNDALYYLDVSNNGDLNLYDSDGTISTLATNVGRYQVDENRIIILSSDLTTLQLFDSVQDAPYVMAVHPSWQQITDWRVR